MRAGGGGYFALSQPKIDGCISHLVCLVCPALAITHHHRNSKDDSSCESLLPVVPLTYRSRREKVPFLLLWLTLLPGVAYFYLYSTRLSNQAKTARGKKQRGSKRTGDDDPDTVYGVEILSHFLQNMQREDLAPSESHVLLRVFTPKSRAHVALFQRVQKQVFREETGNPESQAPVGTAKRYTGDVAGDDAGTAMVGGCRVYAGPSSKIVHQSGVRDTCGAVSPHKI